MSIAFVLELFCGSQRFGKACAREGRLVIGIDVRFGDEHDITRPRLWQAIVGWIQAGWVLYVLLAPPCASWSRIRNAGTGPPPLRDDDHIWGLSTVRDSEKWKVDLGNSTLRVSVCIFRACLRAGVPALIENPLTSWMWVAPPMATLMLCKNVRWVRSDFCQWGTPWRKATRFVCCHLDVAHIENRCTGRGVCSRSGLHHLQLIGKDEHGVFKTRLAEAYPRRLCTRLAKMFEAALCASAAAKWANVLL